MQNSSRSVLGIVKDNVLTLFNVLLAIVALFVISTGSLQNCLFIIIIFINSGIGIITEYKAKRTLDRLSIFTRENYTIIRDEHRISGILAKDIEINDLIEIEAGMQIPVDSVLIEGKIFVNESMLTGESNSVPKTPSESLLSGTFAQVGGGLIKATSKLEDSYASKLSNNAKQFKIAPSDLRDGTNTILKYISMLIIPLSLFLAVTQFIQINGFENWYKIEFIQNSWNDVVLGIAGGIIGMIPEGLVLLTSMNFALAVIILARKKVLLTELNSVETLARVNEIILDKTGTITDGNIKVVNFINSKMQNLIFDNLDNIKPINALYSIVCLKGGTTSSEAIKEYLETEFKDVKTLQIVDSCQFDSKNKFSSVTVLENNEDLCFQYKLGAPEYIYPQIDITKWTSQGQRVLAFTKTAIVSNNHSNEAVSNSELILLVVCEESVRKSIIPIIKYFKQSNVNVQVVSGDNEKTVQNIASKVGISQVVGRAKPETKLKIVRQLQKQGRVVAMTGDGVNDILALKEADLGIAMGNAAPASKAVANIVLIDSDFSLLPEVVKQGRRVIANIERVASLFLVKTFFSIALSLFAIILQMRYPYMPIHLTLVSSLFIGIPAFFLAIAPNNTPYKKGFLKRVVRFSLPIGIICAVIISALAFFAAGTLIYVAVLGVISFLVLASRSKPLFSWRGILLILIILTFIVILIVPNFSHFFLIFD